MDRPAVAEALHRPRQHARPTAGDDDLVGATSVRELALHGGDRRGGPRGGRAQAPSELSARGDRVAADHHNSRAPEKLDEETADRAEADDDDRVAGRDARAPYRAQTA